MNSFGYWPLFTENWFMSVTMVLGSFIAGATSEGGGAVAFPVMTLGYNIKPEVARDFSLMIQSVGMLAASTVIIFKRIEVEWRAILFASIGGVSGIILGIDLLSPVLSPTMTKLFFVSIWSGFGVALIWVNRDRNRHIHSQIENLLKRDAVLIIMVGFMGGLVSGLTGSGLDIVTFSLLVLYFSISEKVATPTSVILMALNSIVGFTWKESTVGMSIEAWEYWWVCVPVVIVGAPLGAWFVSHYSRHYISTILYLSISIQFFWAMVILDLNVYTSMFVTLVLLISISFYFLMFRAGRLRLKNNNE
jgi:uncharacterized membrane protein YfcA